ncbi:MAG: DsbA family protein [Nitrospirales bacterium]|nr:DsbA family protein [Nitrospirales bacterium]
MDNCEQHATALELNLPEFQECVSSERQAEKVQKDIQEGKKAGVKGTPTFFLGFEDHDHQLQVTKALRGAQSYTRFKNVIDRLLSDES